jgi:hypothetical protein
MVGHGVSPGCQTEISQPPFERRVEKLDADWLVSLVEWVLQGSADACGWGGAMKQRHSTNGLQPTGASPPTFNT